VRIPFVKTREEREFERRLKCRRLSRGYQAHLRKLDQARERFRGLLKTALQFDNHESVQRYARACAALGKRVERVQGQVLAVDGIEAIAEMVRIDRDFAQFAAEMGRTMTEAVGQANIAKFQADLEKGIMQAEELDDLLDDVVGSLSDNLMGFGAPAQDDEVDATVQQAISEAEGEQKHDADLEERICKELEQIKTTISKD